MLEFDEQEVRQNHEGRLFFRVLSASEKAMVVVAFNWIKLENLFIQNLIQIILLIDYHDVYRSRWRVLIDNIFRVQFPEAR